MLPGSSTYSLGVANIGTDTLGNVQAVVQLSQILINGVPQYPTVLGLSPAGTYDAANGRITFALGLMGRGTSKSISVQLDMPAGIIDGTEYNVSASVTGQGALCGPATATTSERGQVESSPKLKVFKRDVADLIPSGSAYDYELEYVNVGTAPSTGTFVVDRVPNKTVLVRAYGNPTITRVWFSAVNNLPPQALSPFAPVSGSTIAGQFSPGMLNDNGTPGDPTDDYWTSPFGEQTFWIAWEVDDPALNPPQFLLNTPRLVGFTVRNDDDAQGAGTAGSPEGTLLLNTAGIFSSELLQAIGNQVVTTVRNHPSIIVQKSGPTVVEAGVPFNWVVSYYNNSLTPAQNAVVTDTLPPGITLLGATHTWNAAALANGAPVNNSGRPVPTSVTPNADGSTTVTFVVAGATGYRGNGVLLGALEGGAFTLAVTSDPATASGTTRLNTTCGTADTAGDPITSCDDHQVTIFRPDLELSKYASPATVLAGGTVTYQLVLANRGPIKARDVALVDQLPASVSYVPGSLSVLTPGYTLGAPAISGQTLTWSTANGNALTRTGLPAGEIPGVSGNILIQFNAQVGANVPGCTTLGNVAQVTTVSAEEGAYANTASASVTVPPPELAVAKSGPVLARPGNRVPWDISWVNESAQAASGVYLVDALPNNDADANSDVTFVNVTAPAGVTAYYHAGPLTAAAPFNPFAPLSGGWSSSPVTPVNRIALLVGALAGNAGPFSARVTVDLIDPVSHILPPPGSSFTNTVVIAQAVPLCEDTANNTATAIVRTPSLDVALTKTGSVEGSLPGIAPGDTITYTLAFENSGTVNAYGVRVVDALPATLTPGSPLDNFSVVALVDGTGQPVAPVDLTGAPIGGVVPVTRVLGGGTITWHLGTITPSDALYYQKVGLPPGSKGSFELRAVVAGSVADNTTICNPATVVADVGTEDLLANNSSSSCVVARRADVAVRKFGREMASGDPAFAEFGGLIRYTIEYNNLGSIAAHDVVIDEIVPEGTSLVSVNPPFGATVTYSPNQANATSFSIKFDTLRAPANSVGATASNTVVCVQTTNTSIEVPTPTNCCNNCSPSNFVSHSVTAYPNYNYLVNPLCHGDNTLDTILPSVPDGTLLYLWNRFAQNFSAVLTYIDAGDPALNGWYDAGFTRVNPTLAPGEGFVLKNPSQPFTITFTGCVPTCPPPCAPNPGFTLVGRLGIGAAGYSNLFSCPPACGTEMRVWSPTNQIFNDYNYVNGAWTPQDPVLPDGASAFVAVLGNSNCVTCTTSAPCLTGGSNAVYEGFAVASAGFLGWETLIVDNMAPAGTHITYSVGRVVAGNPVYDLGPLYTSVSVGPNGLDLSGINPAYTSLVLRAEPSSFTTATTNTTLTGNSPTPPSTNTVDTVPPTILSVSCVGNAQQILVTFSEEVDPGTAQEPGNYFLEGGPFVVAALLEPDGKSVLLTLDSPMTENTLYTLSVVFIADLAGNNTVDPTSVSFQSCVTTLSPCLKGWQITYNSANWPAFTFTARADGRGADGCGPLPIDNVVAISTTTPEISLANNAAAYSMNTRLTDLRVQLSVNKAAALQSQLLTYQLDWSVTGPQAAPNTYLQVVLGDGDGNGVADVTLPPFGPVPGVTAYYHTASTLTPPVFDPVTPLANGWTMNRAGANHIAFLLGDLAPNSAGTITYTAVVKPGTAGRTLVSTVNGHTSRRETDCDNSGSALTYIGTLANVFVRQTGPGCVHPGNLVTFTIAYGNNGNAPAANFVVADALPAGLTFISAVPAPTGPGLIWNNLGTTPGTLAALETGVITVVAQVDNNYALIGQTLDNVATISTSSGEVNLGDNQAFAILDCITPDIVSLSGYAYHDRNNNGLRESGAGETGIPDVTITLTGTDVFGSTVTLSTVTDQDGQYSFSGLYPGTYTVTETQPATWASTADTIGTVTGTPRGNNANPLDNVLGAVTLNGGDVGVEYNFGENYLSLGNLVWSDDNNNGRRDTGEPGISGATVQLWSPGANGAIGGGDDQLLGSTTTDANGHYQFTHLLPGRYFVRIPANNFTAGGRLQSLPLSSGPTILTDTGGAGPDNRDVGTQSGGTGTETVSPVVNLALGQEAPAAVDGDDFNGMLTLDFGFTSAAKLVAIGNTVFNDLNADGKQGPAELGIASVIVELYLSGQVPGVNAPVGTTLTDGTGAYLFDLLAPGGYFVHVTAANFQPAGPLAGYLSSPGAGTSATADQAVDENGIDSVTPATTGISSAVFALTVGGAPTGETPTSPTAVPDANACLTVDFGFHCVLPPTITCPPSVAVSCASAVPTPNPAGVTASAACAGCGSGLNVTWAGDVMSGSNCVNKFVITRTYRATDGCGNSATCQQSIAVNDTTPPVITCPPGGSLCRLQLFCGYTQGGWGATPIGNNPAMILQNNFGFVCPGGIVEIGIPGSSGYSAKFTSAAAILAYLPAGNTAGALTADATNPTSTSAGVFGGQVLALQLNVNFSDARVTGGSAGNLGDLPLNDPASPLNGQTVRQILAIANTALGGGNVSSYGVTINSLNTLLDSLNQAFDNCQATAWAMTHLTAPPPPRDGGTATAVDNCAALPVVSYSDAVTNVDTYGSYTITRTWRAVDACGNSSTCNQVLSFRGNPPAGLTTTAASASVALRWKACSGASGYNVKRSTNSGGPYTAIATGLTATNFTDTTVVNGTVYYYVVSAIKAGSETCNSDQATAIPFGPLPSPWSTRDIGVVGAIGGASYGSSKFTVIGSGADIWNADDAFRYAYQTASGDCSIVARVVSVGNTDPWAKAGVMVRESLNSNARHASTFITPANGVAFQYRTTSGGTSIKVNTTGVAAPYWVKMVRSGNTFTSYYSPNGTTWTTIGSQAISMGASVYIGLGVTSHNAGTLCPAVFDNVIATP